MKVKIPTLLAIAGLTALAASSAHAQTYEPGWVVRSNGDTLRGEIENGFWKEPPTYIRFRTTAASPSQLFQPRQLRAVRFTGGRYFRYEVLPIDHAAQTNLVSLPHDNQPRIQVDSLLAEVFLEGPASLLRVVMPGATHYFIQHPTRPVLELSERKYLRPAPNGNWVIADGNNYHGQLAVYFSDCPAALTAAGKATFTPAALVGVVQAYNLACSPTRQPGRSWLAQEAPRRRSALQGGVLTGLRYNRLKNPSSAEARCTDCRARPFLGLYAELLRPSRTTALYGELSASTFSNQILMYAGQTSAGAYLFSEVDYRAVLATARLGLRHFFPLPHEQQWFIGLGYEINMVLNPKVTAITGYPVAVEQADIDYYPSPSLLPHLGTGWRNQRLTLSLDGQFYQENHLYDVGNFFNSNLALRLGLSYRLGRNPDENRQ